MPANQHTIQPFQDLPEAVEIVALGQIRRQPRRALEAEIEVALASRLDGEFDPDVDLHRRWVGCGQIDLLTIGSCWKDGRRIGVVDAEAHAANYSLHGFELLGIGSDEPANRTRLFPTRLVQNAPGFLLKREEEKNRYPTGPRVLLLPQMELVRALFGVSSRFLLQLLDGLRDPVAFDRGILDRTRSAVLEDGTIRLVCWRRPTDDEAIILATMVADHAIMRLHDEVFQQLVVQRDYRDEKPTWPKVTWPFRGPISLKIEGRWFERDNGSNRFLVTRISEIGLQLRFRRVEVLHLGSNHGQSADRSPSPMGRTRSANAHIAVLTTGRPPSPSRRPGEIISEPVIIPARRGITIDYIAKGGPPRPPNSTIGENPRDEGEFSTASRETGGDPHVGRIEVHRSTSGDAPMSGWDRGESLRKTWEAIRTVAASAGWNLTSYPRAAQDCSASRDGGFDFKREGILAGLNVDGQHVILADSGTSLGDRRSLGILVPALGRPVNRSDLRAIRDADERHDGRWGSDAMKVDGFAIAAVRRHPSVWENRDAYISLLFRRIRSIVRTGS